MSKFLLALLIGFGLTLFSCKNAEETFVEKTIMPVVHADESPEMAFDQQTDNSVGTKQNQPDSSIVEFHTPILTLPEIQSEPYLITIETITLGCIAMPHDWILATEGELQTDRNQSLTLDFAPPFNSLEKVLSTNAFEVVDLTQQVNSVTDTLVIESKSMEPIYLFLRDEKGKEKFRYDAKFPMIGENSYVIDYSYCKPGIYFLCIRQGEFEKIIPVEVGITAV